MFYIIFVRIGSQMFHTKFQDHGTSGSEEEEFLKVSAIYGLGGHLGHVPKTILIILLFPFPKRFDIKFGFDWPSSLRTGVLHNGYIHVHSPGARGDIPLGSTFFKNHNSSVTLVICYQFFFPIIE